MAEVTIEGSLSPSTFLARGERARVQRDAHVERLIRKGFVNVVDPEQDAPVEADPATAPEGGEAPEVTAPAKNASGEAWRTFLAEQNVEHDPDATRDELVAVWEARDPE